MDWNIFFFLCFCVSFISLTLFLQQFVNKLRYAKEGARDMMDRACADLPWQVWLEIDEKDIEIPKVCPIARLIKIFTLLIRCIFLCAFYRLRMPRV